MLFLKEINKSIDRKYEVFFDNNKTYNLVSSSQEDVITAYSLEEAGMLIINRSGYVQEVEILFSNPICSYYPNYTSRRIEYGLPILKHISLNDTLLSVLYLDWNRNQSLLLFKFNITEFDLKVSYKNINFLFVNNELLGIETLTLINDYDDLHQTVWLDNIL